MYRHAQQHKNWAGISMHWRIATIAVLGGVIIILIVIIGAFCIANLAQVSSISEDSVAVSIGGGTLSLGALALVFLGYSLDQRLEHWGTDIAKVHSRVAFTMFLLVVFSVLDALISIGYLLVPSSLLNLRSWMFDASLVLVFVIGGILVAATTYVVADEFDR
jgi:hypothetical protein